MDPAIAILFRFDFEAILADPIRLGIFLELAQTIVELEPRAREAAITLALRGKVISGWSLVRREGNRFVESTHVRELLLECPAKQLPLEAVAKLLGNISESRWQTQFNTIGRLDADEAAFQCGATVFFTDAGK